MRRRAAVALAGAAAALAFADAALAANTGSLSVSYGAAATTIKVAAAQADDPIAAVTIYTGTDVASTGGAAGTQIGQVDATAFANDAGLTLPLSGPVTTDDPARHTADLCSPGANAAVWNMVLSALGQTLVIPIYVNRTTGAAAALGTYSLRICLPPWDVPMGTAGRSFQGAQLVDAQLTLGKIFAAPTTLNRWDALFTPYVRGTGNPNPAATFEARAFVPVPVSLGIHATYKRSTNTWGLAGTLTEGGQPVPAGTVVSIFRGTSPGSLKQVATAKTRAGGAWGTAGHLRPRKTTYFRIAAAPGDRDYTAKGCASPAAPAGCVSATLGSWSARSAVVRVTP